MSKLLLIVVLLGLAVPAAHATQANCTAAQFAADTGFSFCSVAVVRAGASLSPSYVSGTTGYTLSGVTTAITTIGLSFITGNSGVAWCYGLATGTCASGHPVTVPATTTCGGGGLGALSSTIGTTGVLGSPSSGSPSNVAYTQNYAPLSTGANCLYLQAYQSSSPVLNAQTLSIDLSVPAAASGDPQIYGIQGQEFQVHGIPDEVFNMVSSPSLQVNAHFAFLTSGQCDNFTACYTHPGTYIDITAFSSSAGDHVRVQAGGIKEGLRVFINEVEKMVSSHTHTVGSMSVVFEAQRKVVVQSSELMFNIYGSDHFMNLESGLLDEKLMAKGSKLVKATPGQVVYPEIALHGLLGQTWKNVEYSDGSDIEGSVADYQVQDGLYGSDFVFNKFVAKL